MRTDILFFPLAPHRPNRRVKKQRRLERSPPPPVFFPSQKRNSLRKKNTTSVLSLSLSLSLSRLWLFRSGEPLGGEQRRALSSRILKTEHCCSKLNSFFFFFFPRLAFGGFRRRFPLCRLSSEMTTGGGVRAAFSPDGGTLAVASADGRLKTFDTGEFFCLERKEERERERRKRRRRRRRRHVFFLSFSALSLCLPSLAPARDKPSASPPVPHFLAAVARGDTYASRCGKSARNRAREG